MNKEKSEELYVDAAGRLKMNLGLNKDVTVFVAGFNANGNFVGTIKWKS